MTEAQKGSGRSDSQLAAGQTIDQRYILRKLLGEGGVGSVYQAFDEGLEEEIALKVLKQKSLEQPGLLSRFKREVRLTRRVAHPNVIRMFDLGRDEERGIYFLTMEYVEGQSLSSMLEEQKKFALVEGLSILQQLCNGLMAAHAEEILHLDLKPDNVLLSHKDRAIITDFGISRHLRGLDAFQSHRGEMLGTPMYMAPEQFQGRETLDFRTDIYAIGAIAYELLTGQAAWQGDNFYTIAMGRFFQAPPNPKELVPTLPEEIASLVMRCMALKPNERYDSVQAVADIIAKELKKQKEPPTDDDDKNEHAGDGDTVLTTFVLPTSVNALDRMRDGSPAETSELPPPEIAKGRQALELLKSDPQPMSSSEPLIPQSQRKEAPSSPRRENSEDNHRPETKTDESKAIGSPPHDANQDAKDTGEVRLSMAVLPLRSEGGLENDYVRATIAEELRRLLAKEHNFDVSAKGLMLPFVGKRPAPDEIFKALGVQLWLEGSIAQVGKSMHLHMKLGETAHERMLWEKQFETNTVGLLETCRQIAEEAHASSIGREPPSPTDTASSEADSLSRKILHALRAHWYTEPNKAIQIFEEAKHQVADSPSLLVGGAVAYARQAYMYDGAQSVTYRTAWALVRQAVELAPEQTEGYYAMAMLHTLGAAWGDALDCLRWALRQDHNYAEAHDMCGRLLLEVGDIDEAIYHLRMAMTQNPDLPNTRWDLLRAYALQEQWSHVDEIFLWPLSSGQERNVFAIHHTRFNLWRPIPQKLEMYRELGSEDMTEMGIQFFLDVLKTHQFTIDDRQHFLKKRLTKTNSPRIRTLMLQELAEILAFTLQWEPCFETIQHALSLDLFDRNWLRLCPLFAPVRQEHRFQELQLELDQKLIPMGIDKM